MSLKRPIFIGGCPRSGTTMLGSMLGGAAGCVVTPESHFKQTLLQSQGAAWREGIERDRLFSELERNVRFRIWHMPLPDRDKYPLLCSAQDYSRLIVDLVDSYARAHDVSDWQTWVDHTPQNIQNPLMLLRLFPEATFIHLVRDPRAVAASVLPLDWGPDTCRQAALFWAQKLAYGLALEQNHAACCMRVHYEELICTPEETLRRICDFCGLIYESSMLEGGAFQLPKYTQQQHQLVGSRPNPDRLNAWKDTLDEWQIQTLENRLGDLMELMEYEASTTGILPKRPLRQNVLRLVMPLVSLCRKIRFAVKRRFYG